MEIITQNEKETQKLGKDLGQEIKKGKAVVIGLEGDLGSGKTTFVQGLAQGLEIKDKITSPTFVIIKKYDFLYHIDCYRIESKDLIKLDFKEIISQANNIVVIEWAERVKDILPQDTLWIKFEYIEEDKRKITYEEISSD